MHDIHLCFDIKVLFVKYELCNWNQGARTGEKTKGKLPW